MVTASIEERLARLEAGYEHLATKSDLAEMEARLLAVIMNGQSDTNRRISDMAEMEARLLAAMMNGQSETNQRIEDTNQRIENTNQRIENTNQRIDSTNQRVDGLSVAINARVDRVFWAVLGVGGGLLAAAVAALIRGAI